MAACAADVSEVRRLLPTSRRTPLVLSFAVAALGACLAAPSSASADPLVSARAKAAVLRVQLAGLQGQADHAVEQYDLAQGLLGQAVTRRISLERELQVARQNGGRQAAVHSARIRALYMSGGAPALYATVLASGTVSDALDRLHSVQRVLGADRAGIATADSTARRLADAEGRAQRAAAAQTELSERTQRLGDAVQQLLIRQQTLISQADREVVAAELAQAAADELASQQAFAVQLARAQAQARASQLAGATSFPTGILAPNETIARVLSAAQAQLGKPYIWGAVGPDSFDCSGFTGFAYAAAGIPLPRTAAQQYQAGPHPSLAELQPGDLLFWATDPADWRSIDHMGMYLGNGQMIVAPHTGDVVKVQDVYAGGFYGATRVDPSVSGRVAGPQWSDTGRR